MFGMTVVDLDQLPHNYLILLFDRLLFFVPMVLLRVLKFWQDGAVGLMGWHLYWLAFHAMAMQLIGSTCDREDT